MAQSTAASDPPWKVTPLLNRDNYHLWHARIHSILNARGLAGYVDGSIPKPLDDATPAEKSNWDRMDARAFLQIDAALTKEEANNLIGGANSARELMDRIELAKEGPRGPVTRFTAMRELYRTQAREGDDIPKHVEKMAGVRWRLERTGYKIEEDEYNWILLASLPDSWDTTTTGWVPNVSVHGKRDWTTPELQDKILQRDRELKAQGSRRKVNWQ